MDIKSELLAEHSKVQATKIADYIGDHKDRFDTLMDFFLNHGYRLSQRAAWVISFCADQYPGLITPYIEPLLVNLETPDLPDAIKRNTLRVLALQGIPSDLSGMAATICFDVLNDASEAVAIRVHAMQILANICQEEPDLADELRETIDAHWLHSKPAFRSRGKKVLKQLDQLAE